VMNAGGSNVEQITKNPANDLQPGWQPWRAHSATHKHVRRTSCDSFLLLPDTRIRGIIALRTNVLSNQTRQV